MKAVYSLPCEFLQHCKGFGQELVALFKCQSCLLQGRLNMIELLHGLCVCVYIHAHMIFMVGLLGVLLSAGENGFGQEPFVELMKSSLQTFLNAACLQQMTYYIDVSTPCKRTP